MNNYAFTKVEQVTSGKPVLPSGSISISKTGRIGLSRGFIEEHGVSADSRASLYWDSSRKAIAITFPPDTQKPTTGSFAKVQAIEGYSIALIGGGSAGYINASGFFKKIGINPSELIGHYQYETLDADNAGIADDGETVFVVTLQ
jgi:hypothetical protein